MAPASARLHAIGRPGPPSPAAGPATLARTLAARGGPIAAWTLGWTLFQWWAVVGWAEGGGIYAALVFAGVLGLVGLDIARRVDRARPGAGIVVPLRRPAGEPAEDEAKAA